MSTDFWRGKRVLLTGHTGFKGAWMALWLHSMGAKVTGIGLPPNTSPNLFTLAKISQILDSHFIDIRNAEKLSSTIKDCSPEIVFHLAAQALVRSSYQDPLYTFDTNIMGTAHVLNAMRDIDSVKVAVLVTTDKVYQNLEQLRPYQEQDHLGGHDPYSASKAASELIISSFRDSYLSEQGIAIASARAGNVIGGGDWSEDRLIPDAIRAWSKNLPIVIRRPKAVRPWQHVLEPLNGYIVLAEKLYQDPSLFGAYNFGPEASDVATVQQVISLAQNTYQSGRSIIEDGMNGPHEAGLLLLDISKAKDVLGIRPRWNLVEAVNHTMAWYQGLDAGKNASSLCEIDIVNFCNA